MNSESFPYVYRAILALEALCNGKRRWGDKTLANIWHITELHNLFPDVKFVHIVRDPRAVAGSHQKLGWKDLLLTAHDWKVSLMKVEWFAQQFPENLLSVRYESLVQKPERELRRICAFLDEPFVEDMLRYDENVDRRLPQQSCRSVTHPNINQPPDLCAQ